MRSTESIHTIFFRIFCTKNHVRTYKYEFFFKRKSIFTELCVACFAGPSLALALVLTLYCNDRHYSYRLISVFKKKK